MTFIARTKNPIPSVEELVSQIHEEQDLAKDLRLLDADEDYTEWAAYDYLSQAHSSLRFLLHQRGWDSRDQATALFRTYQAYLKVTGREDLKQDVRLVGALCENYFVEASQPCALVEYREKGSIKDFPISNPLGHLIRVDEGKWGEELKLLFERPCPLKSGVYMGFC